MTVTPPAGEPVPTRAAARRPEAVRVGVHACLGWLLAGWRMFAARPREWLLLSLALFLGLLLAVVLIVPIPVMGGMVTPVLLVLGVSGMLHAAQVQASGGTPALDHLLEGFRRHPANLALVGLFYCVPLVLVSLLTYVVAAGSLLAGVVGGALGGLATGVANALATLAGGVLFAWTLFALVWTLMLLALWFAPALIMYRSLAPLDAMQASLRASLRNLPAMLLLFVVLYGLSVLAMAMLGLGVLVLIPVATGALHAAYTEVFGSERPEDH